MKDRTFSPQYETNGILHPPRCVCVKCAAGRSSRELDDSMIPKIKELLDNIFLQQLGNNIMGGFNALAQGAPIDQVRVGFLQNMEKMFVVREMAYAYFAEPETAKE